MAFWLIVIVLLLASAALLLLPALANSKQSNTPSRDALNKALYQDRLTELEQQGLLAEQPEWSRELQQTLLDDIPNQPATAVRPINRYALLPGLLLLVLVSVGLYLKTGSRDQVIAWQQVKAQLPELRQRLANEQQQPLSVEEIARLGLALRSSLQHDDRNINDWMLLGRVGMALNNATTAIQAFERAYQLAPENSEIRLAYAEMLIRSADPLDNQQATAMLIKMAAEDHSNLRVWSLLAFNAFEQQDYQRAINAWQMMLKLLPADDQRVAIIQRSIEQAKGQLAE